ncbi:MAG: hypothetical protein JWM68_5572 [Verrucomicrobiales bacterium]|nr:hypothetical protein [Verrucomicrobiales bacterium]
MKTTTKGTGLSAVTLALLLSSAHAFAETEKPGGVLTYKLTDAVIVRPLGMVATLAGGALYLVTWPISSATGNKKEMYNTLVRNPAKLGFGNRQAAQETPLVQKEVVVTKQTAKN